MNVIFFGVQGSGKGTQAKRVSEELNLCHISIGDLFREIVSGEDSPLKEKLSEVMNKGGLVDDELTLEILKERTKKDDCKNGILLDGFPRNIEQARLLDENIKIDKVIEIKISDEEALRRLSGRVSCAICKEGYNLHTAPKPKNENRCDKCGGELVRRSDDNEESIKKRINIYHEETEPILKKYEDILKRIDGEKDIESITKDIIKELRE